MENTFKKTNDSGVTRSAREPSSSQTWAGAAISRRRAKAGAGRPGEAASPRPAAAPRGGSGGQRSARLGENKHRRGNNTRFFVAAPAANASFVRS